MSAAPRFKRAARTVELDDQAAAALEQLLANYRGRPHNDVTPTPAESPSFFALWQRYFREEGRKRDTVRDIARMGKNLCETFGDTPALELNASHCEDHRDRRRKQVTRLQRPPSPATLNREIACARHVLNWAVSEKLLPYNPIAGAQMEQEHNVRQTTVKNEEMLERILDHCDDMIRAIVLAFIDSGFRRMELLRARWDQLDMRSGVVELYSGETKNDEPRRPRLSKRALEAIGKLPRISKWIFANQRVGWMYYGRPYNPRWLYKRFEIAVADARVEGATRADGTKEKITFHTFRHSFVYLRRVRDRIPERSVRRLGGWKTNAAFERYGIGDDQESEEAYRVIDENISIERERLKRDGRRGPLRVQRGEP